MWKEPDKFGIDDYNYQQTEWWYLARYPTLRRDLIIGKRAQNDIRGSVLGWEGTWQIFITQWTKITEELYTALKQRSISTVWVFETNTKKLEEIFEWKWTNPSNIEYWQLLDYFRSSHRYIENSAKNLDEQRTNELFDHVHNTIIDSAKKLFASKRVNLTVLNNFWFMSIIKEILFHIKSNKHWLICLYRLSKLPDIFEHSIETMLISIIFWWKIWLSNKDNLKLAKEALMHDIWFVFIPEELLDKKSHTDIEKRIVETHSIFWYFVLSQDQQSITEESIQAWDHHKSALWWWFWISSEPWSLFVKANKSDDEKKERKWDIITPEQEEIEKKEEDNKKERRVILNIIDKFMSTRKSCNFDPLSTAIKLSNEYSNILTISNPIITRVLFEILNENGWLLAENTYIKLSWNMIDRLQNQVLVREIKEAAKAKSIPLELWILITKKEDNDDKDPFFIRCILVNEEKSKKDHEEKISRVNALKYIDSNKTAVKTALWATSLEKTTFTINLWWELWIYKIKAA